MKQPDPQVYQRIRLRFPMSLTVTQSTMEYLLNATQLMIDNYPKDAPRKPKPGYVVDRLVEHAKATGFAPLKPISDGQNAHRSTKTKTK